MSNPSTPTAIDPATKEAARAAATSGKTEAQRKSDAEKARERRQNAKTIAAQLEKAGIALGPKENLTREQKERALESADRYAGLTGRALSLYILEGKTGREQVAEARAAASRARRTASRSNATRSSDPEAAELAQRAKALAPDIRSSFLPKEGREFIDLFSQVAEGRSITVTRRGAGKIEGALEEVTLDRSALKRFAIDGEKDREIRSQLAGLGKESRLWGRKLGLMILATDAKRS